MVVVGGSGCGMRRDRWYRHGRGWSGTGKNDCAKGLPVRGGGGGDDR